MAEFAPFALESLLRTWRVEVSGLRTGEVARALGVARSAPSNWESGLRTPGPSLLGQIDDLYEAGGALVDMVAALGTPQGLDPCLVWWHNFSPAGGPIWAWIRTAEPTGTVKVRMSWGPLGVSVDRACSDRGVIVALPTSVANPAVRAELSTPGWVDFGQGRVPPRLGIPVINGFAHLRVALSGDPTLALFAERFRTAFSGRGSWLEILKGFAGERPDLVEDALGDAGTNPRVTDLATIVVKPDHADAQTWPGERFRALREARGLSQSHVARAVTVMTGADPVSDDQIGLLEAGGRPRNKYLAARLDVVYRADGRTFLESVEGDKGGEGVSFSFPLWWTGPVWVKTAGPPLSAPAEVVLRWAPWEKRLHLRPGTTVSTRTASENPNPLQVQLPLGWTATAGMGAYPEAVDINAGWHPIDESSADRVLNHYSPAYLQLFGKTSRDLRRLLDKVQMVWDQGQSDADRSFTFDQRPSASR